MERCSFSMHYTRVSDAQQVCIVSRQRRWPGLHPCCSTCSYLFPFLSLSLCVYVISQYNYECHPCYGLTLVVSWAVLTSTV